MICLRQFGIEVTRPCRARRRCKPEDYRGTKMAQTPEIRRDKREVGNPTEPEIRAAMGKAIHEIKRRAAQQNIKPVVANKNSWSVPKGN
jgi:hypothetical protein